MNYPPFFTLEIFLSNLHTSTIVLSSPGLAETTVLSWVLWKTQPLITFRLLPRMHSIGQLWNPNKVRCPHSTVIIKEMNDSKTFQLMLSVLLSNFLTT